MKYLLLLLLSLTVDLVRNEDNVEANNLSSSSFYREILREETLREKYPNFIVSPFLAQTLLGLLQTGSKDETAKEIWTSLHFPEDQNELTTSIKHSLTSLRKLGDKVLGTAGKLYIAKKWGVNDEFRRIATDVYNVGVERIDFKANEEVAKKINDWMEKHTNNKTEILIHPEIIDENTAAFVVNTLYFKGRWNDAFFTFKTQERCFYKTPKKIIKVRMMHHTEMKFPYSENSELDVKILALPMEGTEVYMVIVLPNKKDGLRDLERYQLDKVFALQNLQLETVNVALPKFKIESTYSLVTSLRNLGIHKIFERSEADLSGIAGEKGDLVVSDAVQKAIIDVSEEGVESVAATQIVGSLRRAVSGPKPKDFTADHPFLFYIQAKNVTVLVGRVSVPTY